MDFNIFSIILSDVTIEKMKSVICHLNMISEEKAKLKQVLRSSIADDVWKINKDYHKLVFMSFVKA